MKIRLIVSERGRKLREIALLVAFYRPTTPVMSNTPCRINVATANACCCQSTAPARGQNGTRRVVLAEPVGAVDGEELREPRARTIDPALDGPYRALADRSRLIVGEARRADEKQGLALAGRQHCKRHAEVLEFHRLCCSGGGALTMATTSGESVARNQICCLTSPLPLIYKQNLISACPQPGPARQKITAQPADEAT